MVLPIAALPQFLIAEKSISGADNFSENSLLNKAEVDFHPVVLNIPNICAIGAYQCAPHID
jgi:hypothetical protein